MIHTKILYAQYSDMKYRYIFSDKKHINWTVWSFIIICCAVVAFIAATPDIVLPSNPIFPQNTPLIPQEAFTSVFEEYQIKTPKNLPYVALTFDDSPSAYTESVLLILNQMNVKATFFLIGNEIASFEKLVEQIAQQGHDIANHTWSTKGLWGTTAVEAIEDVSKTEKAIEKVLGRGTPWIRPPYNSASRDAIAALGKAGYRFVLYDLDAGDFFYNQSESVLNNIKNAKPGDIILLHDGRITSDTLRAVIKLLRENGLEPISLSQLLSYAIQ